MDQYFFPTSHYRFWKGRHKTALIIRPGDHLCRKSNRIYKNSLVLTRILARLQDTRSIHKNQQCETNLYDPRMGDTHHYICVKLKKCTVVLPWQLSKESTCNAGYWDSIPGMGRSPGEGNGNPLQYSCLVNPMDREACQATVHGVPRVRPNLVTKPSPKNVQYKE